MDVTYDFTGRIVLNPLLSGMYDPEIQKDLLVMDNVTLEEALKKIADSEAAKRSQSILTGKAEASSISTYQKDKKKKTLAKGSLFGHCGSEMHGEDSKDRQDKCRAMGKTCKKCGRKNHFKKVQIQR